jgi:hypothetical protein
VGKLVNDVEHPISASIVGAVLDKVVGLNVIILRAAIALVVLPTLSVSANEVQTPAPWTVAARLIRKENSTALEYI